jgi:predicted DNA-binding transcriptional regulator YafY
MDTIRRACWREEALTIRYADKGHAVTERTTLSLAIVYTDSTLTMLAWCCLREAFRMFLLERIIELKYQGTAFGRSASCFCASILLHCASAMETKHCRPLHRGHSAKF